MDIAKFVNSLLPNIKKRSVMEDIRSIRDSVGEHTLPPYETAAQHFDNVGFASRQVKDFDREFLSQVDTRMRGNSIRLIYEALRYSQDHIDILENLAEREYNEEIASTALSYRKANLLQTVQSLSFMATYARSLLNWILAEEAYATDTPGSLPADKMIKQPELEMLNAKKHAFYHTVTIFLQTAKELKKTILAIPDMLVNDESYAVAGKTLGLNKIDPMKFSLASVKLNPIYHVSMVVAEWQASRYKVAKEEQQMLELRLLQMTSENRETPNTKLEQNIEHTQDRLNKLKFKLKRLEEKYA